MKELTHVGLPISGVPEAAIYFDVRRGPNLVKTQGRPDDLGTVSTIRPTRDQVANRMALRAQVRVRASVE